MSLKPTAKSLRAELMSKLINVKGLSKSGAQSVVSQLSHNTASLQAAIDDLNMQGLFASASTVDQAEKFNQEQREKVAYNFQIERGRLNALRAIADGDGASVSHHIRQAVADYLKKHAKR